MSKSDTSAIDCSAVHCDVSGVYFGNLFPNEPQYKSGLFHGLALVANYDRDIAHDACAPLPFPDGSIKYMQSQDVFEHLEYTKVSAVFDEIFRCLRAGGVFRLSLPDYHSPLLRSRSVYDSRGKILCDLALGGRVDCELGGKINVCYVPGGDSHLWFPTYANVLHLVMTSQLRKCMHIKFHHFWWDDHDFVCDAFNQSFMPVSRTPPADMRAEGKPISIVADFVK